jgi:hypothetical protein
LEALTNDSKFYKGRLHLHEKLMPLSLSIFNYTT